jgi:hypothetical protein
MLLTGSRALAAQDPTFKLNPDADWDFIVYSEDFKQMITTVIPKSEVEFAEELNNHYVYDNFISDTVVETPVGPVECVSLRGLAAIKRSHLWRDHFFDKHITQYHKHLKAHRDPQDDQFIQARAKLTKEMIRYAQPSLLKSNEEFFDDAVDKKYDHDWLHELVAFGDHPIYLDMKRDHSLAWCEKDLWDQFPQEKKLQCVAEETMVIALERFLIPNDWDYPIIGAYAKALQKVCTTLSSGWFRDFAIDNHPEIMALFDKQKIQQLKGKLT